jgi:hypothetical protein
MPEGVNMDDEQTRKHVEDLARAYGGLGKSHKLIAVPGGSSFSRVGIPPNEAQFLETRRFQKADIASLFRVPLHMIQETEKNTSWGSGIYSMTLNFVTFTLRPWAARIEQALDRQLLSDAERETYFFEFNLDAILRGDLSSQSDYFTAAIQNGWLSRNEVRDIINRNPVDGGDEYLTPMNMTVAGDAPPPAESEPEPDDRGACGCGHEHRAPAPAEMRASSRPSIANSYQRVIVDAMDRVLLRESNDITTMADRLLNKKSVTDFTGWLENYYTEHQEFTREQITPAFTALAEAVGAEAMREIGELWEWSDELETWLADYIDAFANRHSNRSRQQLLDLIAATVADEGDVLDAMTVRFDEWSTGRVDGALTRSEKIAAENTTRLGQGFAREAFFAAGVAALVWVATGSETCPYCQSLDGRSVGSTGAFLLAGEDFAPGGAEPLSPSNDVFHPPCHGGCDCMLIPSL